MKRSRTVSSNTRYFNLAIWTVVAAFLLYFSSLQAAENDGYWSSVAERIGNHISQAEKHYQQGDAKAARRSVVQAYFGEFEDTKMEAAMRMEMSAKHTWRVEKKFGAMRKAIKKGASQDEIGAIAADIRQAISRDAKLLDKAGITPEVFKVNQ